MKGTTQGDTGERPEQQSPRTARSPFAQFLILAGVLLCALAGSAASDPTPEQQAKIQDLAAKLHGTAKGTLAVCGSKYEAAYDSGEEPTPCAQVVDVEVAYSNLIRALKDAHLDPRAAEEYWTTWDIVRKGIAARESETKVGYSSRQATLEKRLNEAGTRLMLALKG